MSKTITLPDDLEQVLVGKAEEEGISLEQYVIEALWRVVKMPTLDELFADIREDIEARGITDEEIERDIDEAVAEVRVRRRG
ncbi:MAG TPA: hypothetical protein VEF04_18045 [Blastocatellia bacterium]|nr:hypothetical protein [Blastocatellia bacterium]